MSVHFRTGEVSDMRALELLTAAKFRVGLTRAEYNLTIPAYIAAGLGVGKRLTRGGWSCEQV